MVSQAGPVTLRFPSEPHCSQQQVPSPLWQVRECFPAGDSREVGGREFRKEEDGLLIQTGLQKSVPFSCGTIHKLLSFWASMFIPEKWRDKVM